MDYSKLVDAEFTQLLPKIELHAHLTGSISRQCLHDIWVQKKAQDPDLSVDDPWVIMPPGKVDYSLSTFFNVFSQSIYHLCNDLPSIAYATTSVLTDFLNDGVRYLELRTIPRPSPTAAFTRHEYLDTVLTTIEQFRLSNPDLTIALILALDRATTSAPDALAIVDLALAHRARGIVGLDLCGNPTKGDVAIYGPAFAKAKEHELGVTLHFGEVARPATPGELETLLGFEPDRLGHVIHVPGPVKEEIVRRRLGLELCLSCNVHAQMFDGGFTDHHFGEWWRGAECPVVLCTDDVGFFCSPVSNEYRLAAEHFGLSRTDVLRMCRDSVEVIFGGEEEKARLRGLLDEFEAEYTK
ncbi:Metallo-dependent hydrolase [Aspergillus steynii IBT 23096]|uniref:Metallo-dependent hydrolase n=1 Tax=Aspergillus steynii IBT 23096 TaxID=1392250 RepID=A0A2I2FSB6_9EURO|nr:Metallo-dependent hydrolase [Aspergillus steynii IBT 23096]PLB43522.1 Metallo-dependent hydrolase [Aspergillus steynii IBT 23096]